jgi:outer membrane protein assembly factor BamB
MKIDPRSLIFAGIRECVVALDAETGDLVWRTELAQKGYTSIMWDGEKLIATNAGEVYRLEPRYGEIMWRNELKGLGRGLVSLASGRRGADADSIDMAAFAEQAAAAAAASGAAG